MCTLNAINFVYTVHVYSVRYQPFVYTVHVYSVECTAQCFCMVLLTLAVEEVWKDCLLSLLLLSTILYNKINTLIYKSVG